MESFIQEGDNDNKSVMIINNLVLDRNLPTGGRAKVEASRAYISKQGKYASLDNCSIRYVANNIDVLATAKKCVYIEDKKITLRSSIKGKINDVSFFGDNNSIFEFYITKGYGIMEGGVKISEKGNSVEAGKLEIFKEKRALYFSKGVRVKYEN
ncbi:MAG: hypothetical protein SVN78_08905 [Deferribacterota bacterium]|nr:hypothetical protein [Deferribacterota bacterium]